MPFSIKPAAPIDDRLLIAIAGPQGSGKTTSALKLATGIVQAKGGKICLIDTENNRSLRYSTKFKFDHIDFQPPFGSLRYLEAIQQADAAGYDVIIVDSMSHEHEGPGGLLEQHEEFLNKKAGDDYAKRDQLKMTAWIRPKADRNRLITFGLQRVRAHVILCFRAKEKTEIVRDDKGKNKPVNGGWQMIGGEEFGYEMNIIMVLPPGSKGCPDWSQKCARINDIDGPLTRLLLDTKQITEETGRKIRELCQAPSPAHVILDADELALKARKAAKSGYAGFCEYWQGLIPAQRDIIRPDLPEYERISKQADNPFQSHQESEAFPVDTRNEPEKSVSPQIETPSFRIENYDLAKRADTRNAVLALCMLLEALPNSDRAGAFVSHGGSQLIEALDEHGLGVLRSGFTDLGIEVHDGKGEIPNFFKRAGGGHAATV